MTTALTSSTVQAVPAVAERRHRAWLLVGAVVVAVVALPSVVLDGSVLATVLVAVGILALTGAAVISRRHRAHDWAQEATRTALETAAAAGSLHGWVEDLDLPGGGIDHAVLNPAGVFVVESSWHAMGLSTKALRQEAASAHAAAARTRSAVRACGVPAGVRPVVAVWGAGSSDLPTGGTTTGDVLFIRGAELTGFLRWAAEFGGAWSYAEATDCLLDLRDIPATGRVLAGAR